MSEEVRITFDWVNQEQRTVYRGLEAVGILLGQRFYPYDDRAFDASDLQSIWKEMHRIEVKSRSFRPR
jgi:hypothetical protein